MNAPSHRRLEARVEGRVQGVGFRYFTRKTAQSLGLAGWVRNEHDGSVRVVAEGPRDVLERLVHALRDGPPGARVRDVHADWHDATGAFDGFGVRH